MKEFLQKVYFHNTVQDYLFAFAAMLLTWIVLQLVKKFLIRLLFKLASRTKSDFDEVLIEAVDKYVLPYVYLLINFLIIKQLTLNAKFEKVLDVAMLIITVWYVVRFINKTVEGMLRAYLTSKNEAGERLNQLKGLLLIAKVLVWIIGLILLIDNLGYNVTTIIAGLGVGGIAIALAAQNILGDLFSYFVIFFDKPFEIGDAINVGDETGTVERIGIKTSHIRSVNGEQLIMPNAELVKKTIHNFKRQGKKRRLFSLGVTYQTTHEQLEMIPGLVQHVIESRSLTEFQRCHLSNFGDFSINYEIAYLVLSNDYNDYMNMHHQVCLGIVKAFSEKGIEFAYPTQTLFLNRESSENHPN